MREIIELNEYTPTQFLKEMKSTYGNPVNDEYDLPGLQDLPTLTNILNGRRTLTNDIAQKAALLLDIDVNYLLGTKDNYSEATYNDYLSFIGGPGNIKEVWSKYSKVLNIAGYRIISATYADNELQTFVVTKQGRSAHVSSEDMDRFYEDVRRYVEKRFDPVMELSL